LTIADFRLDGKLASVSRSLHGIDAVEHEAERRCSLTKPLRLPLVVFTNAASTWFGYRRAERL
jgi:hypothetical protein